MNNTKKILSIKIKLFILLFQNNLNLSIYFVYTK
jgi:hypothetical protein